MAFSKDVLTDMARGLDEGNDGKLSSSCRVSSNRPIIIIRHNFFVRRSAILEELHARLGEGRIQQ